MGVWRDVRLSACCPRMTFLDYLDTPFSDLLHYQDTSLPEKREPEQQWLKAPVVEPPQGGKPPSVQRNGWGTPQGGVLSPLLANIYLHWFDHLFQRGDGPA